MSEFVPSDTSRQTYCLREGLAVLNRLGSNAHQTTVVDLGCGLGASYDQFTAKDQGIRWIGIDIADSPEAMGHSRRAECLTYDGVNIPLEDNSVDLVYSRQVFEHVRHPEALIADTARVLRPGGVFVGSASSLEPFHSRSFWNYTPYGFCILLRDAGFQTVSVRPGIDGLTLVTRRLFDCVGLAGLFEPFFKRESPLNLALEVGLRVLRQPVGARNALKLFFAGHFVFAAAKPGQKTVRSQR
jgi:SAM-dependent methyltransferase